MSVFASSPRLSTRLRAGVAVGGFAVLASGLVYAAAGSAAAPTTCFTYTDPTGDAVLTSSDPSASTYDPDMDIVGITHQVNGTAFVSQINVVTLSSLGPNIPWFGDRFKVLFTINKHAFTMSTQRDFDPTGAPTPLNDSFTRVTVDGVDNPMKVTPTYDFTKNVVSIAVPLADMEKAAGVPLVGASISAMTAQAVATMNATQLPPNPAGASTVPGLVYDSADDGTKTAIIESGCGGGVTPGPTGTPAPTGTPEPTGTPAPTGPPVPPPATGGFAGFATPRKGCFDTPDSATDSQAKLAGAVPYPGSDPDTELTGMVGRTTGGRFSAFIGDPGVSDTGKGTLQDGDVFTYSFTVAGKAVTITASRSGGTADAPAVTVAGKDATSALKPAAVYDSKNGFVILSIDVAGLAKTAGTTIARGTVFTATQATSTWVDVLGFPTASDTVQAAKPADQIYNVATDACFYPPAGTFDLLRLPTTQFGHGVDTGVTLNDSTGNPAPGQTVTFTLGSTTVSAVTDGDGFATLLVPANVKAGAQHMAISFAGTADIGPVSVSEPVTITVAKTKLALSSARTGSTRTVKSTLTDDAKHAVAGQPVVFSYGSKKVTVNTDSHGVAQLKGVPAGSSVTVSFAGSSGYYAPVKATIKV